MTRNTFLATICALFTDPFIEKTEEKDQWLEAAKAAGHRIIYTKTGYYTEV